MTKHYTLIYTDFGDSCDGLARVLGTFKDMKSAQKEMKSDIKCYLKANKNMKDNITFEYDNAVLIGDECDGCQWQILEVEVNNETEIKKAKPNSS